MTHAESSATGIDRHALASAERAPGARRVARTLGRDRLPASRLRRSSTNALEVLESGEVRLQDAIAQRSPSVAHRWRRG